MSAIKEIRELTGLSQYKIAAWLGVSRSLVQLVEDGKRGLPHNASMKLSAMTLLVQQIKEAGIVNKADQINHATREKIALGHKRKMEQYQYRVASLQMQLDKLRASQPRAVSRLTLMDALANNNIDFLVKTEQDNKWIELMEWFTKEHISATDPDGPEILQDKIDILNAYIEVHKMQLQKFINS